MASLAFIEEILKTLALLINDVCWQLALLYTCGFLTHTYDIKYWKIPGKLYLIMNGGAGTQYSRCMNDGRYTNPDKLKGFTSVRTDT